MLSLPSYKALIERRQALLQAADHAGGELHSLATSLRILPGSDDLQYYKPEYFKIAELVPPSIIAAVGENVAWLLLDARIVWTADAIRNYFGKPFSINIPGFPERGFRPWTPGKYSQHNFGRAIDGDVKGLSAEEVRKEILTHQNDPAFRFINRMELDTRWLHVDAASVPQRITTFKP